MYSSNHAFIAAGAKQKHNKNTPFMMYTYMHFLNYIRELFWYISIKHCLSGSDVEILVMQCHDPIYIADITDTNKNACYCDVKMPFVT